MTRILLPLAISLIPKQLWGRNLRKWLTDDEWQTVRAFAKLQAGGPGNMTCASCAAPLNKGGHVHEHWLYNDERHLQSLGGVYLVCHKCHSCVHAGRSSRVMTPEQFEDLGKHFERHTGGCLVYEFNLAMATWKHRNQFIWRQDREGAMQKARMMIEMMEKQNANAAS